MTHQSMTPYWERRYAAQGGRTVGHCSFSRGQFDESTAKVRGIAARELARLGFKDRVLDLGCGCGRMSSVLADLGCEVHGLDVVEWAVKQAAAAVPSGQFQVFDGETVPFPPGHFDAVLTWTVLQHVPPGQVGTLASEIMRVLAPGAVLACYENVTAGLEPKEHIWFRSADHYARMFEDLKLLEATAMVAVDGNSEVHALMAWRKECR